MTPKCTISIISRLGLAAFTSLGLLSAVACTSDPGSLIYDSKSDYSSVLVAFTALPLETLSRRDPELFTDVEGVQISMLRFDTKPLVHMSMTRFGSRDSLVGKTAQLTVRTFMPGNENANAGNDGPRLLDDDGVYTTVHTVFSDTQSIDLEDFDSLMSELSNDGLFEESLNGSPPKSGTSCAHLTPSYYVEALRADDEALISRRGCYNGDYGEDLRFGRRLYRFALERMPVLGSRLDFAIEARGFTQENTVRD